MNATELMIGDFVMVCGVPRRVESITKKKIGYHLNPQTDKRLYYARLHDVEPIAITKELLSRNKFLGDCCYWNYHIDEQIRLEYYFHEHRFRKLWCGIDEWQNHSRVVEVSYMSHCTYLHELQHACRECGVEIKL